MSNLLVIDACPRGKGVSRTLELLDSFLEGYEGEIERIDLSQMGLLPLNGESQALRSSLIDQGKLDHPMFAPAKQFAAADQIVIAAPYWDLSFPAILKTYIENIFVRTVCFVYDDTGCVGLCRAKRMAYLTTSGSPIPPHLNMGGDYLKEVANMLGIKGFCQVSAQGLDLIGADIKAIMDEARAQALELGREFSKG